MVCDDRQLTQAQREAGYDAQRTGVQRAVRPYSGDPTIENLIDYLNRELYPAVKQTRDKVNDVYLQVADNAPSANPLGFYFSTETANADPTAGYLRLNNATQNAATVVRVSQTNARLVDVAPWLDVMNGGATEPLGVLTITDAINPARFLRFDLDTMTDQGDYWDLEVSFIESSHDNPFVQDQALLLGFIPGLGATPVVIPPEAISPIPADTFLGNITTADAPPTAVPLADVDSTSIVYDATSHTFQRAALTGFAAAAQNSNATTSAEPIVTFSASSNMTNERVLSNGDSTAVDTGTTGQIQVDYTGTTSAIVLTTPTGNLGTRDISALLCGGAYVIGGGGGTWTIEGFTAKAEGFWFVLVTAPPASGGFAGTLANEDATATATNRLILPGGADFTQAGIHAVIMYRSGRWRVIPGATGFPLTDGDKGDITVSSSGTNWQIDAGAVGNTELADMASPRLKGRTTSGTGDPEDLTLTGSTSVTWNTATGGAISVERAALTGDVTATANSNATTIANDAVTNAKLANMAEWRFKGRDYGVGTGDPQDLTANEAGSIIRFGVEESVTITGDTVGLSVAEETAVLRFGTGGTAANLHSIVAPDVAGQVISIYTDLGGATALTLIHASASEATTTNHIHCPGGVNVRLTIFDVARVQYVRSRWRVISIAKPNVLTDGDKGDITVSSNGTNWQIDAGAVGNTELADMAESRVKGRSEGAGTGAPEDLTPTQVVAIIDGEDATWTGDHVFDARIGNNGVYSAIVTAQVDDLDIGAASVVSLLRESGSILTGMVPAFDGQLVWIEDRGAGDGSGNPSELFNGELEIHHDSTSSTAANRFYCPYGDTYRVPGGTGVWARYSGVMDRWILGDTGYFWGVDVQAPGVGTAVVRCRELEFYDGEGIAIDLTSTVSSFYTTAEITVSLDLVGPDTILANVTGANARPTPYDLSLLAGSRLTYSAGVLNVNLAAAYAWTGVHSFTSSSFTVTTSGTTSLTGGAVTIESTATDVTLTANDDLVGSALIGCVAFGAGTTANGAAGNGVFTVDATADVTLNTSGGGLMLNVGHTSTSAVDNGDIVLNATGGVGIRANASTPISGATAGEVTIEATGDVHIESGNGFGVFVGHTRTNVEANEAHINATQAIALTVNASSPTTNANNSQITLTPITHVNIAGGLLLSAVETVTSASSVTETYSLGANTSVLRFNLTANDRVYTLEGLTGGTNGRVLLIVNVSTTTGTRVQLENEDASATAADRFLFNTVSSEMGFSGTAWDFKGTRIAIAGHMSMLVWYDGTSSRWRPLEHGRYSLVT